MGCRQSKAMCEEEGGSGHQEAHGPKHGGAIVQRETLQSLADLRFLFA